MRRALSLLAAIGALALGTPAASAQTTHHAIAARIASQLRLAGGHSGAWAQDLYTGKTLFARDADVPRTPASVEKLLTSSTSLARLGEKAQFETLVRVTGALTPDGVLSGDIYVQGFGDPSFAGSGLARLATAVERAGVVDVAGRVYGDESYFDRRRGLPSGGFRVSSDVGPLSALSFDEGRIIGRPWSFQPDPPTYVAQRFRAALIRRGITVDGETRARTAPTGATLVAAVKSPSLGLLIRHMNGISDNYYAETLVKGLGARFGGSGTTASGAAVVGRFARTLGVSATVLDGSGLSRPDAVSPAAVGTLLRLAPQEPWFGAFYGSLPLAGRTGTLRDRMRGTPAAGRCRAKTGTLIGVSALAGYCRTRLGHRVAFALLMNGVAVWRARLAQDRIAAALAGYD